MNRLKQLSLSATAIFLASCAALDKGEVVETIEKDKVRISEITKQEDSTPDVKLFDFPFVESLTSETANMPNWTFEVVGGGYRNTLDNLMGELVRPLHVNIDYRDGVREESKTTVYNISVPKDGTVLDAIQSISTASGYAYVIEGNKIAWQKYLTETFKISHITGETEVLFTAGKSDETQEGNKIGSKYNILADTEKSLRSFLRLPLEELSTQAGATQQPLPQSSSQDGLSMPVEVKSMAEIQRESMPERMVYVDHGMSTVTVKATPAEMAEVRRMINDRNEFLTRQVYIEMEVLNVEFNDSDQQAIDFNLIKQFSDGDLVGTFASSAANITLGTAFGKGLFTLTDNAGANSGSQLFIEALQQQGKVSTTTLPGARVANNKKATIKQTNNTFYINDRPATSTSVTAQAGITQKELKVGFTMEVMPVVHDNTIQLKIKTIMNSLIDLKTKGSAGQEVESPETKESQFDTYFQLKNGETAVFSQLKDASNSVKETKSGWGLFGWGDKVEQTNSETILLIKATII